jgi:hypothetical protein
MTYKLPVPGTSFVYKRYNSYKVDAAPIYVTEGVVTNSFFDSIGYTVVQTLLPNGETMDFYNDSFFEPGPMDLVEVEEK